MVLHDTLAYGFGIGPLPALSSGVFLIIYLFIYFWSKALLELSFSTWWIFLKFGTKTPLESLEYQTWIWTHKKVGVTKSI